MKRLIPFTAGIFLYASANAQVLPTQNFESWAVGNPPDPTGWTSANILYAFGGGDTVCHKSTTANSGSFAMKLETMKLNSNAASGLGVPDTVSFAFTGSIVTFPTASIKTGYPFSTRPQYLDYFYKYTPVAGDSGTAGIVLTKWITGVGRDTVATAMKHLGAQSNYTIDSLPLVYKPAYSTTGNPDSAFVYFASSNIQAFAIFTNGNMGMVYNSAKLGSMLWVDDWWPTSVGINESKQTIQFSAYPVPANDCYTLQFERAEKRILQVYDVTGKMLEELKSGDKVVTVKTSGYPNGIYVINIKDEHGKTSATEKFIINH